MILSDATIKAELAAGRLVVGGTADLVGPCSYEFVAGKIITGGEKAAVVDWSAPAAGAAFVIMPGAMVWIRMKERVTLPADVCATWWQTNSLSRQGIMLINMSVVDPGYNGPLACLFVNFGKSCVAIYPTTKVAKLIFHRTDHPVTAPYASRMSDTQYDNGLFTTAVTGASSFLNVSQLSPELTVQKDKILRQLAEDAPKTVGIAIGWAAFGLVLLTGALSFVPWLQSKITPNLKESIGAVVDERLMDKLVLPRAPADDRTSAMLKRLDALEAHMNAQAPAALPK